MKYNNDTLQRCVKVTVQCDNCKVVYAIEGLVNLTTLKTVFKRNGWSFGKYLKCPKCNNRTKERKENE